MSRIIALAIALFVGLAMPRGVAAKGHGGGHSSGGHSSGGHAGGGHSSGGHSSAHAAGGHASGGHASQGKAGSGRATTGKSPSIAPSQPRRSSRTPDGGAIVGTAAARSTRSHDLSVVTPSIYAPHFFLPRLNSFGFAPGIRHLGYGFGPAYYDFGYGNPLLCETSFNCDIVPMFGAVEVPPSYDDGSPYPYQAAPADIGTGTVRIDVQPVTAQVFVDGEYVGTVEDFRSGSGLEMAAGIHRVEFRAIGREPLVVDMRIAAGRRITYRGVVKSPQP